METIQCDAVFSRRTNWNLTANRLTRALEEHRQAGKELLDLSASNPTIIGLRYDMESIMPALADARALQYHPEPKGMLSAREAVADYYRLHGAELDFGQIILTTSTSEAYAFLFRLLCDPGDEVLVPAPSYPLFDFLADLQDVKLARYSLLYDHGWQMDLRSVEAALTPRTRAILIVHPNNPTGSYVQKEELSALNEICAARELALIADEVFLDYAHQPGIKFSFSSNPGALTFTLSGISKICCLPQMKLAWIAASGPKEKVSAALARLEIIADTFLSMNAPIQLAAQVLLAQRGLIQKQLMERIKNNLAELDRQLAEQNLCSRLDVQGGWYAILRIPAVRSDEDLLVHILQKCSVLVHPGHFYDFASEGFLVLSLIAHPQEFAEGIRRVLSEVHRCA